MSYISAKTLIPDFITESIPFETVKPVLDEILKLACDKVVIERKYTEKDYKQYINGKPAYYFSNDNEVIGVKMSPLPKDKDFKYSYGKQKPFKSASYLNNYLTFSKELPEKFNITVQYKITYSDESYSYKDCPSRLLNNTLIEFIGVFFISYYKQAEKISVETLLEYIKKLKGEKHGNN